MCRFKVLKLGLQNLLIIVSIHPMCRFKEDKRGVKKFEWGFNTSYVSVQGSNCSSLKERKKSFNTSYVSVQVAPFQIL